MPDSHADSGERAAARHPGSLRSGLLVLAGLSSLAFAQPVFDILGRSPEFFAVRGNSSGDLLALVFLLAVVPTLVLAAPAVLVRMIRPAWTGPAVAAAVGVLTAVIGLQALRGLPAAAAVAAATAAGAVAGSAYLRFRAVRFFGRLLAAAAVIVPALVLIDPDIRESAAASNRSIAVDPIDTGARAPIVLVVFDEWSLTSILDRNGAIDRQRMPNLARLADRATWYPNATAAADNTVLSVPAMLTGVRARQGQLPTVDEHPVNLFTLLAASHDLHVVESITTLCPPELNQLVSPRQPTGERFGLLVSDLAIVWLERTLPSPWRDRLPAVTRTWSGFGRNVLRPIFPRHEQRDRAARFRRFVQTIEPSNRRPGLYFLHSMLPHVPWEYLPSGRRYAVPRRGVHGLDREIWGENPWSVLHHRKRYLLQVEFVDRLIGELVAQLDSTGLFDRSLIAIAADHGVSFQPGRPRRPIEAAEPDNAELLDIASVPLLLKAPFQQQPAIDETPMSLVGLAGRILALAGADAEAAPLPPRPPDRLTMTGKYAGEVDVAGNRERWRQRRLMEQAGLLGKANDPMAIGVRPGLHGRPTTDFPIRTGDARIRIDNAWAWTDVDPELPAVPVLVKGRFDQPLPATDQDLAVALNGVIAATPRPHVAADGSTRIVSVLPEARLAAGPNAMDVFLIGETGGRIQLELVRRQVELERHVIPWTPNPVYVVSRNGRGQIDALVRRSSSARDASVDRYVVSRQSPDGLQGNLDGNVARGFAFQGWAFDHGDPESVLEVVLFLAGSQYGVGASDVRRPDVATHFGSEHLHSGFLLGPDGAAASHRFRSDESLAEAIRREGVIAYAVSRRGRAARLHFQYRPIEHRTRGVATLPISDGRSLTVQRPGDGFEGSVDRVVNGNGTTTIEGWAADLRTGEQPLQIVIYRNGEFLTRMGPTRNRPDVVEHYGDPRLQHIGFRGEVPGAPAPAAFSRHHRVFAIMQRGAALELPFHHQGNDEGHP